MGVANNIGKYQLSRTIGEGTFAKVKLAVNTENGQYVAIKIIDKTWSWRTISSFREIRTMKLLHHPNIVRIHEVIGTKTKIYIVMEYVSGGQLSDKMLDEQDARKHFQQLIDAVDYCHGRGELAFGQQRKCKVSDFGLSALRKPGDVLSTACGRHAMISRNRQMNNEPEFPSIPWLMLHVSAEQLLANRGYDGAAADIWSCGVILFELLAGYLPFDDRNLMSLYKKITRAEYTCPEWFTPSQTKLISRILDPNPRRRISIAEIVEDEWFQIDYEPASGIEFDDKINLDDVHAAFNLIEENNAEAKVPHSSFINAFQLIAMSHDLDLSGLFEEKDDNKQKARFGSKHTIDETIKKIEAAAKDVSLSVERKNSKMKMHPQQKMTRCSRSYFNLSAEVIEVAPTHCVVEISKSAGELGVYKEFCTSLSCLLKEKSGIPLEEKDSNEDVVNSKDIQETECSEKKDDKDDKDDKDINGYSSS
ncbi:CBL-interacting serine/threonine-protein kinase 21 [Vitis vinifera]|uniref:non-specific serine/threonine protein kinase n=1 Tax=Vitis vinifera TaxID=29760 RepID=A0A438H5E7_VITVI|nr:CBL-interacting serine/threonine-protein kinase 21 [Vitis vinifera]